MLASVKTLFAQAATVGAVAPSSSHLAKSMASHTPAAAHLIELGAGDGAITKALVAQHPKAHLTAVEIRLDAARRLGHRFPQVDVKTCSAACVLDTWPAGNEDVAVVSALPFRSLPLAARTETLDALERFFERHPHATWVQFTYHPRAPFSLGTGSELQWHYKETVFRNIPPAGVWLLEHKNKRRL